MRTKHCLGTSLRVHFSIAHSAVAGQSIAKRGELNPYYEATCQMSPEPNTMVKNTCPMAGIGTLPLPMAPTWKKMGASRAQTERKPAYQDQGRQRGHSVG